MYRRTTPNKIYKLFCWAFLFSYTFTTITLHGHGFAADTLIQLDDKSLWPMHTIYSATMYTRVPITSYNIVTSSNESQRIKATKQDESRHCMHIGFDADSDDNENSDIICTIIQEFYLPKIDQWLPACKLIVGDELLTSSMTTKPITYIKIISNPLPIYMLEVENSHTFFVGKHSVLAHNIPLPTIWLGFSIAFDIGGPGMAASSVFGPISLAVGISIGLLQFAVIKIIEHNSSKNEIEIPRPAPTPTYANNNYSYNEIERPKPVPTLPYMNDTYPHYNEKHQQVEYVISPEPTQIGCGRSHIPKPEIPDNAPCANLPETPAYPCGTSQQKSNEIIIEHSCNYSKQYPSSGEIIAPPCNYSLQYPTSAGISYGCGSTTVSVNIDTKSLINNFAAASKETQSGRYNGKTYHRTEDWVKEMEAQHGKVFERTDFIIQGKRAFQVIKDIPGTALKKGMYVILDALHKDHFEVYAKNREWIFVINFDGTKNEQKTNKAEGTPRHKLQ